MRILFAILLSLIAGIASATTIVGTVAPTTTDAAGAPLPASGAGALTSHRYELGTCVGAVFGTVLQTKTVAMPAVKVTFLGAPTGVLCLRAFPLNSFGEGSPYPVSVIGPVPSNAGSIILITVGP